ncbi:putative ankyrin repeat protein RF_0381 isoform X2 [Octopus sinensis]|uniref:Ankyrin repeat protein RF_0381 isoform X2 n=1 Tax=Octopus sinensis TaxID=2607531 RepID=A0A6P7TZC9_9MOLL|nr:putative ankyrin repeat protein RF_0381 isoform X2 [Octopus sinensis]
MSSLSSLQINKPFHGRTPLIFACEVGADRRIIDILIKAGAKLGAKDKCGGWTALHLAVEGNHLHAVEILLSRGSEVNPRDEDGRTPLHVACDRGHLHTVDLLLGHNGIDANVVADNGDTPLHVAVRGRDYKLVSLLLSKDSVNLEIVNKEYRTPLLEAVSDGHLGIMQRLIARGTNVNVVEHGGNNCLHLALETENNFHSEVEHMTMLDQFCVELKLGNEERCSGVVVASYLAHHGANFYCKNKIGRTPLDLIEKENLKKTLNMLFPPQCMFCEDEVATETFFPCKHLSLCKKCCPQKIPKRCHMCGQNITSKNNLVGPNSSKMEVQMVAGPVGSPELKEKDLLRVAKRLGRDWWQVAIVLGVDTTKLKIDDESIDAVKQGYLMLYEWFKTCDPETRTHATLRAALEEAECDAAMECLSLDAK